MKNKNWVLGIAAAIILYGNGVISYAAPVEMPDGTMFDAEYYAQQNPDVVKTLGTSQEALYQHYVQYGREEGRLPAAPDDKSTDTPNSASNEIVATQTLGFENEVVGKVTTGWIYTLADGTMVSEVSYDYLARNYKDGFGAEYLIPRTDYNSGLIDEDGNGIDDRDPYNNCGYTDRNYNGIADEAPELSYMKESMMSPGRLCEHGVVKAGWFFEDFCQPCKEGYARLAARMKELGIRWE